MALYSTFGEILTQMRAEARLSTNPAVGAGANDRYKALINRVYATLFDDYDWPHLRYEAPWIPLAAGQRYYDTPIGIDHNRIESVVAWWNEEPYPLDPGIGFKEYAAFSSENDERADPVQRYDLRSLTDGSTQIEVWPLPASSGMSLQITGVRKLSKLVNSSDVCLLDDYLVALFAAQEILRPISSDDADTKLAAGKARLQQLRARAVQPQTGGTSAPTVGTGRINVGLRNGKAVVRVGRS